MLDNVHDTEGCLQNYPLYGRPRAARAARQYYSNCAKLDSAWLELNTKG